ncbi:4Fe-4S dicluster domain-containing protein [Desulforudis sp. 1088]|uniref:4Fe-4S dicluster domain-containing protein n=1 Tax=unclassified Candidatus Desulforudis TaxID=2635950 RepID=UPI003CE4F52D
MAGYTHLNEDRKGVLVDITKCIGCRSCQVACKNWNNLPAEKTSFTNDWTNPPKTSATTWTRVAFRLIEENNGGIKWRFVKNQCFHCEEPACESACFVHAFIKLADGPVVYKPNICVGCRYCMLACPFGVPAYEWDKAFPEVKKCTFCADRQKEGLGPACVSTCPTGALKFGVRKELLEEAKQRIAASPGKYQPTVYGEKEYGGTSWLYISDVPFEQMGFKTNVSERSIPSYTWSVLKWTPYIAVGWTAALTALYLYTKRRAEVEEDH